MRAVAVVFEYVHRAIDALATEGGFGYRGTVFCDEAFGGFAHGADVEASVRHPCGRLYNAVEQRERRFSDFIALLKPQLQACSGVPPTPAYDNSTKIASDKLRMLCICFLRFLS